MGPTEIVLAVAGNKCGAGDVHAAPASHSGRSGEQAPGVDAGGKGVRRLDRRRVRRDERAHRAERAVAL